MVDQSIVVLLKKMEASNKLTADAVAAEAARKKANPQLYEYFASRGCFDPKQSQKNWQLVVARELIRTVKVNVITTTVQVKAPMFVRDPSARPNQGYVSTVRLRTEEDRAREVLVEEFARASAVLSRAKALAAAFDLENDIEDIVDRIDKLRSGLKPPDDEDRPNA
jgi:hypothetical protein